MMTGEDIRISFAFIIEVMRNMRSLVRWTGRSDPMRKH